MPLVHVTDMKPEAQIKTLKDICKQIAESDDDALEGNAEILLDALVTALDENDQDDGWGTEGWQHRFGYDG